MGDQKNVAYMGFHLFMLVNNKIDMLTFDGGYVHSLLTVKPSFCWC